MYGVTREGTRKQKQAKNTSLHDEINSFRLFKEAKSGLRIKKYFSQRHRLHLLEVGLYEAACFKIPLVTLNFVKLSWCCKYQMYLLRSVLCLLFALENKDLWFEYLENVLFRLPSASQKRACLSSLYNYPPKGRWTVVDIPSYGNQSKRAKIAIHWFGKY